MAFDKSPIYDHMIVPAADIEITSEIERMIHFVDEQGAARRQELGEPLDPDR